MGTLPRYTSGGRAAPVAAEQSSFAQIVFALANVHLNLLGRLTARLARRKGRFSNEERRAVVGPYRHKLARRHLQNLLLGVRVESDFFASVEKRLGTFADVPVLFVYGVHDNGYAAGFLERWKSFLPRHEVVLLSESGHFPLEDGRRSSKRP